MNKPIIAALTIILLTSCTEKENTVSTELTINRATQTETSAEYTSTEADNKLIKDTIILLDDKDFWRKSTNMQTLDKTQLTFTLLAPMEEMHSKWNNNNHPATRPCQNALKLFNQVSLALSENKINKDIDDQYEESYRQCRSYLK